MSPADPPAADPRASLAATSEGGTKNEPVAKTARDSKSGRAGAEAEDAGERLQKLISRAGMASRRAAEDLIREGRVSVNGHVVTELGLRADPTRDRIIVDGHPLIMRGGAPVVVLLHKPKGVVTTCDDPEKRDTVLDLLPVKYRHLHPIGRLDYDTSGVLLLTDDGELTHLLTHPSHGVEKVYHARVRGRVDEVALKRLETGINLDGQKTAPCRVRVRVQTEQNALVELTLREGRYRQVRRMLEAVGHPVSSLRRIRFDELDLEGLPAGAYRVLLPGEVTRLRRRVEAKIKAPAKPAAEQRTAPASTPTSAPAAAPKTPRSKSPLQGKPPARSRPVTKSKAIARARPEDTKRRAGAARPTDKPAAAQRPATPGPRAPRPIPAVPEWKQRPVSRSTRNQRPVTERKAGSEGKASNERRPENEPRSHAQKASHAPKTSRAPKSSGEAARRPSSPRREIEGARRPAREVPGTGAHPLSQRIRRQWDKDAGQEK